MRCDLIRVRRFLATLARSPATEVSLTLTKDETSLSRDVVRNYPTALEACLLAEDQTIWSAHVRSAATSRREPKRYVAELSLG